MKVPVARSPAGGGIKLTEFLVPLLFRPGCSSRQLGASVRVSRQFGRPWKAQAGRVQNSGYPHTGFFFDHHHAQLGRPPRRSRAFRVRRSVLTGRRIKAPVSAPGFFLSCRISRKVVCTPLPAVWERCTHTGRRTCRRGVYFSARHTPEGSHFRSPQ